MRQWWCAEWRRLLRESMRRREAGKSKSSSNNVPNSNNSKKVSRDSSSSAAGRSKELARGIYRSAGRSRCGIRRRSSGSNNRDRHSNSRSSAIINKRETNKGEVNQRVTIRVGADSLRSHSRESSGVRTRISRGIRQRRTFTRRMTVR